MTKVLRPDGREYDEFRRPILKFRRVGANDMLEYTVADNALFVEIVPSKKITVDLINLQCSELFPFQQKLAQRIIS